MFIYRGKHFRAGITVLMTASSTCSIWVCPVPPIQWLYCSQTMGSIVFLLFMNTVEYLFKRDGLDRIKLLRSALYPLNNGYIVLKQWYIYYIFYIWTQWGIILKGGRAVSLDRLKVPRCQRAVKVVTLNGGSLNGNNSRGNYRVYVRKTAFNFWLTCG